VRLHHLSLTNFRNYARLELSLPARLSVFQGSNAQGKTNLLEAIHLLATARSPRATAERELINWLALEGPLPYARLTAEIGDGKTADWPTGPQRVDRLELVLELGTNGGGLGPLVRKQVRINGVAKRGLDLIGRLRVVLFLPEDVSLVVGAPGERRRYLDIALCQIDPVYCRTLTEYNKVLSQRNSLLKRLRDEGGDPGQLIFWDEQMAAAGALVLGRRARAVCTLDELARMRHRELSGGAEWLELTYLPSPSPATQRQITPGVPNYAEMPAEQTTEILAAHLRAQRSRDIAAGTTLAGPHRDDLAFLAESRDLRTFGSRGQQRTAALALKLAEVQMMREITGESPLLLLDDVMSELDEARRRALLDALAGVDQALVTTTDWSDFSEELLAHSRRYHVDAGRLAEV
jgi:DNA replication and repair protein RecF